MENNFQPFYKRYSFFELIYLLLSGIRTKIVFSQARIIRFPFDVRGKQFISVSKGFTTGKGCRLEAYPIDGKSKVLFIGENVQINDNVHITAMQKVVVGNGVLMASKIYISDCVHGFYGEGETNSSPLVPPNERNYDIKPVEIEENVWIGESASIMPGVKIGKGTIIGANSVVTKSIPDYVIAVGIPAKPVKKYNFDTHKWEKINS